MSWMIREADLDDVPALARLHVRTFNETHGEGPGNPTVEVRERQWRELLRKADPNDFCVLLEDGNGNLVGFARGRPHDGGVPGFAGELNKIYLLRGYHGRGLGRRLVGHVAREFIKRGIGSMLLFGGADFPSNGFYEHLGAERLLSDTGEFHGGYGWRDLGRLEAACGFEPSTG